MMSSGEIGMKRSLHDLTEDSTTVRALRFKADDRGSSNVFQTESQDESEIPGQSSSTIEVNANTNVLRHQPHFEELRGESRTEPPACINRSILQNSRVASLPPGVIYYGRDCKHP